MKLEIVSLLFVRFVLLCPHRDRSQQFWWMIEKALFRPAIEKPYLLRERRRRGAQSAEAEAAEASSTVIADNLVCLLLLLLSSRSRSRDPPPPVAVARARRPSITIASDSSRGSTCDREMKRRERAKTLSRNRDNGAKNGFSLSFFTVSLSFLSFQAPNQPPPAGGAATPHEPNSSAPATPLALPWAAEAAAEAAAPAAAAAAAATVAPETSEPPSAETRAGRQAAEEALARGLHVSASRRWRCGWRSGPRAAEGEGGRRRGRGRSPSPSAFVLFFFGGGGPVARPPPAPRSRAATAAAALEGRQGPCSEVGGQGRKRHGTSGASRGRGDEE